MAAFAFTVAAITFSAAAATAGYVVAAHLADGWRNLARPHKARGPAAAQVAVFLHRQRTGSYTLEVINEGLGIAR